jgi:peptidyl-prolyl cis-trans isomerase B (cyclophilin B)
MNAKRSCAECGTENPDTSRFCVVCGHVMSPGAGAGAVRRHGNRPGELGFLQRPELLTATGVAVAVLALGSMWIGTSRHSTAYTSTSQSSTYTGSDSSGSLDATGGTESDPANGTQPAEADPDVVPTSADQSQPGSCAYTPTGSPAAPVSGLPPAAPADPLPTQMSLRLNSGSVDIELAPSAAPCTVNSFQFLAGQHYFDGTPCHRLTAAGIFVLQCGDPTGRGTGGPGYQFPDENLAGATYPAGTVAMANNGPGTNGSQFFLVYRLSPLPPDYTPFGRVVNGLDLLRAIAAGGSRPAGDGTPISPVTVEQLTTE